MKISTLIVAVLTCFVLAVLTQSVSAVTAVVTVQVVAVPTGRLRSIVTDVAGKFNSTIKQRLGCSDSFWLFFAYKKFARRN